MAQTTPAAAGWERHARPLAGGWQRGAVMGARMKITDVRGRLLVFPLPAVFHPAWARGRPMREITMVLIEVETDEGITGVGAAHAGAETLLAIDRVVRPYFLGQD